MACSPRKRRRPASSRAARTSDWCWAKQVTPRSAISATARRYTGLLDQFAVWPKALGAADMVEHGNGANYIQRGNGALVACSFDSGTAVDDAGGTLIGAMSGVDIGKGKSGKALWFLQSGRRDLGRRRRGAQGRGRPGAGRARSWPPAASCSTNGTPIPRFSPAPWPWPKAPSS